MKIFSSVVQSRSTAIACTMLLTFAWGVFAAVHLSSFHRTGQWVYMMFFISESFIALMYVIRTKPASISDDPLDWILAVSSTLGPLLLSPASSALYPDAKILIFLGVAIQLAGLLSLNRSFGIVPAQRQIKTTGLYGIIRHPLYASYFLSNLGYVLTNTSTRNVTIYAMTMVLLYFRLLREEKHLARDMAYRRYMSLVKYRIIPFVL